MYINYFSCFLVNEIGIEGDYAERTIAAVMKQQVQRG